MVIITIVIIVKSFLLGNNAAVRNGGYLRRSAQYHKQIQASVRGKRVEGKATSRGLREALKGIKNNIQEARKGMEGGYGGACVVCDGWD